MTILDVPEPHREFFKNQIPYYVDQQNRLYVHGGFNRHFHIADKIYNSPQVLMWDRDLFMQALSYEAYNMDQKQKPFKIKDQFKEVFIGHTATVNFNTDKPLKAGPIWNLDTGAGFKGKLTIMEVSTKKYWQSDEVSELYQNERGRN
jgi:serine/threonine protein phosphatase 1